MKYLLSNQHEVAHCWANQIQQKGKAGSLFFEGSTIYSYGYHFEIAKIVKPEVVLFTEKSYSVTTSRHKTIARLAIPDYFKVFPLETLNNCATTTDHIHNLTYYLKQAEEFLNKAIMARTLAESYAKTARRWLSIFADYSKEFEVDTKQFNKVVNALSDAIVNFKIPEKYLPYIKARLQEKTKDWEKHLKQWKNHAGNYLNCSIPAAKFDYLRINGDNIETSKHVCLPISSALLIWRKIQRNESINGEKIDNKWTIKDNNNKFLHVGCHMILHSEIRDIAKQLGY